MNEFLFLFFYQRASCAYCHDRIWGLGRQGFKCIVCKLLIHKKCHKLIKIACSTEQVGPSSSLPPPLSIFDRLSQSNWPP